jgi:hypothetical protein
MIIVCLIIIHTRESGTGCQAVALAIGMAISFFGSRFDSEFLGSGRLRHLRVAAQLNAILSF